MPVSKEAKEEKNFKHATNSQHHYGYVIMACNNFRAHFTFFLKVALFTNMV